MPSGVPCSGKIKFCSICGKEYMPITNNQKYCKECYSIAQRKRSRKWYLENKELAIKRSQQWASEHPELIQERIKQWCLEHPDEVREHRKRENNKRRDFGFVSLNEWFEDSEAHHIDMVYVIYMPKEVHKSIPHSVLKNKNMDIINAVAFNYLH